MFIACNVNGKSDVTADVFLIVGIVQNPSELPQLSLNYILNQLDLREFQPALFLNPKLRIEITGNILKPAK